MDDASKTLFYRNIVEDWCIHHDEDSTTLLEYLEEVFQVNKKKLTEHTVEAESSASIRSTLFVVGVGLLTYGRLDVLRDVLDNIPVEGRVKRLANVVKTLLPLPERLGLVDPSQILDWVANQKENLVWDDNSLKFVYRTSKPLEH